MYRKILIITAIVAIIIGLLALITGTLALLGLYEPGYNTFRLLILYNVLMGIVSIFAGYQIWNGHAVAEKLSGVILLGHITVLVMLVTLFHHIIAVQSILAMMFRVVVWVALFITTHKVFRKNIHT
jgi:hypothetical protein